MNTIMNTMKSWLMTVFMVAALTGGGAALAGSHSGEEAGGDHKAHHSEHHGKDWAARMGKLLDLSDDQQAQVKAIMAEAREAGVRSTYRDARKAMKEAVRDEADETTLRQRARAAADARVDMILHHRTVHEQINELLSGDQRQQLAEHKEAMREKMKGEKKKRYHHGHKKSDSDN